MPRERPRRLRRQATFAEPRGHFTAYAMIFLACCLIAGVVQLTMAP